MGDVAEVIPEHEGPRTVLGESPRWDGHRWSWVDADRGTVWCRTPGSDASLVTDRQGRVSLCHPTSTGGYVVVDGLVPRVVDVGNRPAEFVSWSDQLAPEGWLVNDGCGDAAGRLWIGTIHPDRTPGAGQLIMVERDGRPVVARDGLHLSNGMAWHPDGETLYHADSGHRVVWAHRLDPATGAVVESRVHLDFAPAEGIPDGLATDVDGGLWVAAYGTGEVRRHLDGRVEHIVQVPTLQVTAVEIGGPSGAELLITTAREGYDEARSAAEPLAGRLFRADAGVRGLRRSALAG